MLTVAIACDIIFLFPFPYRKAQLPLQCFLYPELSALCWKWWLPHPQPALCVQSPTCIIPRSSPPLEGPHSSPMHVAAALLVESSAGQWVGFSPACLSSFLSPHCTSSQQFQHIQRWAVPNLHYLYMRSSKGFSRCMSCQHLASQVPHSFLPKLPLASDKL